MWIKRAPTPAEVEQHGRNYPDAIVNPVFGFITLWEGEMDRRTILDDNMSPPGYWLAQNHNSIFGPQPMLVRLRVIDGNVYINHGFTVWRPFEMADWCQSHQRDSRWTMYRSNLN